MSQYPSQPPYNNQPDGNNPQQPYYNNQPNQPPPWQPQPPQGYPQNYQTPPQYPYPQPGQQMPQQPQKKKRKSIKETWNSGTAGKCGVIATVVLALLVCTACSGIANALSQGSQTASTSQVAATDTPVPTDTPQPTDTPVPTVKPKPTAKPKPTQSPGQIETAYKASTTDTDVATLDKDGNNDTGNEEHFTATLIGFVKDSSGVTGGANVSDAATSSVVQVLFTPGTDISQMNAQDTIEVWGTNQGVSSGTNAFGGTVQEVVIQAKYLSDQTTGYKADS